MSPLFLQSSLGEMPTGMGDWMWQQPKCIALVLATFKLGDQSIRKKWTNWICFKLLLQSPSVSSGLIGTTSMPASQPACLPTGERMKRTFLIKKMTFLVEKLGPAEWRRRQRDRSKGLEIAIDDFNCFYFMLLVDCLINSSLNNQYFYKKNWPTSAKLSLFLIFCFQIKWQIPLTKE